MNGVSNRANTGSANQPNPRLASVIPSCVALNAASKLPTTRRAIRARRFPFPANGCNCVSRTLTIANSAATKNPFSSTNTTTSNGPKMNSAIPGWSMLQMHLSKNEPQEILHAHQPELPVIATQHHRQPLPAALHPSQSQFEV